MTFRPPRTSFSFFVWASAWTFAFLAHSVVGSAAEIAPKQIEITVSRAPFVKAFRDLDDNPKLIGVRIRPVFDGEAVRGWEFLEVGPQSIFGLMKIKKDDVLLRVESEQPSTPGAAAGPSILPDVFFPDFQNVSSFRLILERKGKPTRIQFHLRPSR